MLWTYRNSLVINVALWLTTIFQRWLVAKITAYYWLCTSFHHLMWISFVNIVFCSSIATFYLTIPLIANIKYFYFYSQLSSEASKAFQRSNIDCLTFPEQVNSMQVPGEYHQADINHAYTWQHQWIIGQFSTEVIFNM